MAIPIDGLQDYVRLLPDIVITKLYEDTIFNRFNQFTTYTDVVAGPHRARIFSPVANLTACCDLRVGNSNILEKNMEAYCIADGQEYCETDLMALITSYTSTRDRVTAGDKQTSLEEVIVQGQVAAFTEAVDILLAQGDTTLPDTDANRNLRQLDGLIKQANDSTATLKPTITANNAWDVIRQMVNALPREAKAMGGIAILVPEELAEVYFDYVQFRYPNTPDYVYGSNIPVKGLPGYTVVPWRGLNGTNTIIATPFDNVVFLVNRREDVNTINFEYSNYHRRYFWDIFTILGVSFLVDAYVAIAEFDPTILTNSPAYNVNIVSPLNAAGTALQTEELA